MTVACTEEKAVETAAPAATEQAQPAVATFANEREKQSYVTGAFMGQQMTRMLEAYKELGIELDAKQIEQGIVDGINNNSQVEEAELQEVLAALESERMEAVQALQAKMEEEQAKATEEAKAAGVAFLAENAKKEGIVVTESGLQYEVVEAGEGDSPAATDTVEVHYRGTLIDGTQFDSSYDRGQPATFPLNQVIAGWTEGVQLMKPGSKYRFYIPSDLAYGERGAGDSVPGNSTLIFDVELLSVNPSAEAVQ
ncbi:FKBP-type peptidyl-prolyl cis-trans isomerase [Echinimonas agarilytica]|uniref:Peptidyl-prolyl cis-trans isomerase n=2 Tax=Echinimonas agarilytica TaxID=1215918 RepID=A0AA41W4A3_9GAMM|nr:FKBP-type peptidyl-prolyl cis-trans isomerase [Echinimonas agarilytica]